MGVSVRVFVCVRVCVFLCVCVWLCVRVCAFRGKLAHPKLELVSASDGFFVCV